MNTPASEKARQRAWTPIAAIRSLSRCLGQPYRLRIFAWCAPPPKLIRDPADTDARLEALNPQIVAMWHGQFLLLPLIKPKNMPVNDMVAKHVDGEMIGRALLHFDMGLIRGAGAGESGQGPGRRRRAPSRAEGAEGEYHGCDDDGCAAGPARVGGLGIVTLARMSGRPIVPTAMATGRFITLPTWSRFTINLPFTKIAMVVGKPIYVPRDADEKALEAFRQEVEAGMNAATERAYELAGSDIRKTPAKGRESAAVRRFAGSVSRRDLGRASGGDDDPQEARSARVRKCRSACPSALAGKRGSADGPLFWFHAASVGETNSILPLMHELKRRYPALTLLLTTITVTSAKIAASRLPEGAIHQFMPLDSPGFCRRFIDHWRPDLGLFTESEIWPNLVVEANDAEAPLVLVNGRMSPRSAKRWSRPSSLSQAGFLALRSGVHAELALREAPYQLGVRKPPSPAI